MWLRSYRKSKVENLISELIVLFLRGNTLDSFVYSGCFSKFVLVLWLCFWLQDILGFYEMCSRLSLNAEV